MYRLDYIEEVAAQVERERREMVESGYASAMVRKIDECLSSYLQDWQAFDNKWPDPGRPFAVALDVNSHTGILPFVFGKHVLESYPDYPIHWFPSVNGVDGGSQIEFLRASLLVQMKQLLTRERREDVLFADSQGNGVYPSDTVRLNGLSQAKFNGKEGVVERKDPKDSNRIAVKVNGESKSLKPSNLMLVPTGQGFKRNVTYDEALAIDKDLDTLDKLISWSIEAMPVAALGGDQFPWLRFIRQKALSMSCCLVTCTNLLVRRGDEVPAIWKDLVCLAGEALRVGGYLIHLDTNRYGEGFGDEDVMRKYGLEDATACMELVSIDRNPVEDSELEDQLILVVWKKMGSVQNTQEELEFVWNMQDRRTKARSSYRK